MSGEPTIFTMYAIILATGLFIYQLLDVFQFSGVKNVKENNLPVSKYKATSVCKCMYMLTSVYCEVKF